MGKRGPKGDGLELVWFRIAPDVLNCLRTEAKARGTTVSAILRELVGAGLAARDKGDWELQAEQVAQCDGYKTAKELLSGRWLREAES